MSGFPHILIQYVRQKELFELVILYEVHCRQVGKIIDAISLSMYGTCIDDSCGKDIWVHSAKPLHPRPEKRPQENQKMDREQHRELMSEWAEGDHHIGQTFVSDGPVDWDLWEKHGSPRILFLGKEAHGGDGSWDLSQWLRDRGPYGNIWWKVAYVAYGLGGLTRDSMLPSPLEQWEEVKGDVDTAFRSVAVVNVKKSGGRPSSNNEDLRGYVYKDGDLVKRQVMGLQPHFIVCGNTWGLVKDLWPYTKDVSPQVYRLDNELFLDYWHPASHYPNVMYYYTAMVLMQKAMLRGEK